MKRHRTAWGAVFAWACAICALCSSFVGSYGMLGAIAGAILGAVLADRFCLGSASFKNISRVFLGSAIFLLALAWAIKLIPLPIRLGLIADEVLDLGPKAGLLVFLMRSVSIRQFWFRSVEAACVGVLFAQGFSAHRLGHLGYPRGLMDFCMSRGGDGELLLWLVGAFSLLLIVMVLSSGSEHRRSWSNWASIIVIPLVLFGISWWLPRLPFLPPTAPPPPRSQAPDPPPPPPPDPQPIALVQLQGKYHPPERLGGYYFRSSTMSQLEGLTFVQATGELADSDAVWRVPTNAPQILANDGTATLYTVAANISMMVMTSPVVLVEAIELSPLPRPEPPFQTAFQCLSMRLGSSRYPDLDLATFRQMLGDRSWSAAHSNLYLAAPNDESLRNLKDQILEGLPPQLLEYLPPRVKMIRTWMNEQLAYSAKAASAADELPITNFLFTVRQGGSKQFAVAAGLMFRCAGIPSRLASGYVFPVGPDKELSQFVVMDAHAQTWPEIYLEGTGWLPVTLSPTNVIDRPPPPEDPELEKILEQKAEQASKNPRSLPYGRWVFPAGAVLAAMLGIWVMIVIYQRYFSVLLGPEEDRHRLALRAALSIVMAAGWKRDYGETYLDLAKRIRRDECSSREQTAEAFEAIVLMHRNSYETKEIYSRRDWVKLLYRLTWLVLRYHPCRSWKAYPLIRLKNI